jgi:hypothetical protein
MTAQEREQLIIQIDKQYHWYLRGSRLWSFVHHGSLYMSAVLSAASALTLKLDVYKDLAARNDLAAVLATIAALLGTLAAAGGFGRKWQSNRVSRGRIQNLRLDIDASDADAARIREELKKVIADHDRALVGQGA